jgi:L-cystine transport system substrate-binding protein
MKRKTWLVALLLVLSLVALAACSSGEEKTTEDGKKIIKVALSDEVNPPYLYTDENNNPIGFDMDYLAEVEKRLEDYKFEYTFGEEEGNLIGVETGKFDFAINWFFKNPEREEKFLYPEQEFGYSLTALIVHEDTNDIKSLEDMVDKKLAPMGASGGLRTILNSYNKQNPDQQVEIDTIEHPSNADNMNRVAEGKSDAVFLNKTTFDAIQEDLQLPLKIGGVVSKEPIYVVFKKDHTELAAKFDEITKELIEDGTLPELSEKWFGVNFFEDLEYINQQNFEHKN